MKRSYLSLAFAVLLVAVLAGGLFAGPFFRGGTRGGGSCSPGMVCGPNGCYVVSQPLGGSANSSTVPSLPASSYVVPAAAAPEDVPHGVDRSKGVGLVDEIHLGPDDGKKHGADVGKITLPEDAAKPYVVIVGDKDYRAAALKAAQDADADKVFHVVAYEEDQFQGKGVGYSKGIWVMGPADKEGKAVVFSCDADVESCKGPLKRFVEMLRKPDGILDKAGLPNLSRMIDPGAFVWDLFKESLGPLLSIVSVAMAGVAVFKR